jgi:hypothetical protein
MSLLTSTHMAEAAELYHVQVDAGDDDVVPED